MSGISIRLHDKLHECGQHESGTWRSLHIPDIVKKVQVPVSGCTFNLLSVVVPAYPCLYGKNYLVLHRRSSAMC